MKVRKYDNEIFSKNYLSVAQILVKLADPTFLYAELGRGSGKTTHILAPRIDRIQHDMPGSVILLAGPTYKSVLESIVPGLIEYFNENYERGIYFEVGKTPPNHFLPCYSFIENWKHTISMCNGTVFQFVSADRPESALGKNGAHLVVDEMLRIPEEKFTNRVMPAMRSNRSKFGHSHFFMGITGTSSSPDMEIDETWFTQYEQNMDKELIQCIQEIALEVDLRYADLFEAQNKLDLTSQKKSKAFIDRWEERLRDLRRGETYYLRASSFSNVKILGVDYIENMVKSLKNEDDLNTSIFAIRKHKVKQRFFAKFDKKHIFEDSYDYTRIDSQAVGTMEEHNSLDLKYCNPSDTLYAGYDAGPFSSVVFAQRDRNKKTFRVIKAICSITPEQHDELAAKINKFFIHHKRKTIILHYDRAANQHDPKYRDFYPLMGDVSDTDAILLKTALERLGWSVQLMTMGQPVIYFSQHYRLLNILFGKNDGDRDEILIDKNECENLISSIYNSPIKRQEGMIKLDKSSETKLEYKDQEYYSTQLSSALMYLLWGEYKKLTPASDRINTGTFIV